jgi:ribosomal protein L18E
VRFLALVAALAARVFSVSAIIRLRTAGGSLLTLDLGTGTLGCG